MAVSKIAVTIDTKTLERLDRLVEQRAYCSRSRAIQEALEEKLARLDRVRLARECDKLNREEEQQLADAGLAAETVQWPAY